MSAKEYADHCERHIPGFLSTTSLPSEAIEQSNPMFKNACLAFASYELEERDSGIHALYTMYLLRNVGQTIAKMQEMIENAKEINVSLGYHQLHKTCGPDKVRAFVIQEMATVGASQDDLAAYEAKLGDSYVLALNVFTLTEVFGMGSLILAFKTSWKSS